MTISRVELQGQITRATDFTTIKHQEDSKGMVEQSSIHHQMDKKEEVKSRQVQQKDHTENGEKRFDAREQGNGFYHGDGGKRRKEKKEEDGKVIMKGHGMGGFDIRV